MLSDLADALYPRTTIGRTACFIQALSDPIIVFAIAKIVFVGRHWTHITNGHRTKYAWIFTIWMVADRTIVFHGRRSVLLCDDKRYKCQHSLKWHYLQYKLFLVVFNVAKCWEVMLLIDIIHLNLLNTNKLLIQMFFFLSNLLQCMYPN